MSTNLRKVRIVGDGTSKGTKIYDVATGEPLTGVQAIKFEIAVSSSARCRFVTIEQICQLDEIDVQVDLDKFEQDVSALQVTQAAPIGDSLTREPTPPLTKKLITCPSDTGMFKGLGPVNVREDGTCSYCGSLDPDILMERIEAGTIKLTGSDKAYKTYIENDGGAPLLQSIRVDKDGGADPAKWVWETREVSQGKFYFEHLSVEQRKRFVELWNEGRIKNSLYVMPFFMMRSAPQPAEASPIMPRNKSA
jgi:hypothetical protein